MDETIFLSFHKIEEEPEEEPELTPEEAEFEAYRESVEKQLKPCPFCGSNDIHIINSYPHYPFCLGCGAEIRHTPYAFAEDGVRQAAERWNRRTENNQEA